MTSAYLSPRMMERAWSYDDWCYRRELLCNVWERKSVGVRKELLSVIIAHSDECADVSDSHRKLKSV